MGDRFHYQGDKRRTISFPLGGIGTGCVGLDGTGRLIDWEIFNRPAKGTLNGYAHFAVKAERGGEVVDARVLNADLLPPYMGSEVAGSRFNGFGFGPPREMMSGIPHFRDNEFVGQFPFAKVNFQDESFPGDAALSAFNPFIPLDDKNSSLPAAFFEVTLKNTGSEPLDYSVAFSLKNPTKGSAVNRFYQEHGVTAMILDANDLPGDSPDFGQLSMSVTDKDVSYQQYWYRGGWYDNLAMFWRNFTTAGPLQNRVYDETASGVQMATLCVKKSCAPGETISFRFLMSWYYPNFQNYWSPEKCDCGDGCCEPVVHTWKNYYATIFTSAVDVAKYIFPKWDVLLSETQSFADALYSSSLPEEAIEAVGANLSVLKSPTCLRLTDGSFYGFEGCHCAAGCCEGSCQHVWNYAFALPYLFPQLERSMRELDYTYNLREDGGMPFRLQLPPGREKSTFRPCVDGQMGGLIKTYREWKLGAGDAWLREWWPKVKKSLEFAWSPTNIDRWDANRTGVMTGRQHHTLDMELFGPNSWLNGFYLAALKAGAEMADAMGDGESAKLYRRLFEQGREFTERELWNGEFYYHKLDLSDKSVLDPYIGTDVLIGGDFVETYWNDEVGELKYQIGEGSAIDQVLAQWMCDLVGLGDIFDRERVKKALHTIYKHNFKKSFRFHVNPCRIFCLNDEAGTTICEWPDMSKKPAVAAPYSEETMHGFEYQAASHVIARGMEAEGLEMVRGVRDRYDGARRNPWNEFECGNNYARSMAAYALLLIYSGFVCDMSVGRIGMKPLKHAESQQFMWSMSGAWGVMKFEKGEVSLEVTGGELTLKEWVMPEAGKIKAVTLGGKAVAFAAKGDALAFAAPVTVKVGEKLVAK